MTVGWGTSHGRRIGHVSLHMAHGSHDHHVAHPGPLAEVLRELSEPVPECIGASEALGETRNAPEPSDDELDERARRILAGLPSLEDTLDHNVPLTLLVDLLNPLGPDDERMAREDD